MNACGTDLGQAKSIAGNGSVAKRQKKARLRAGRSRDLYLQGILDGAVCHKALKNSPVVSPSTNGGRAKVGNFASKPFSIPSSR